MQHYQLLDNDIAHVTLDTTVVADAYDDLIVALVSIGVERHLTLRGHVLGNVREQ